MISVVDYGLGNILAFVNIYKRLNIPVEVVSDKDHLSSATKLILPGVGSFDWAMARLNESGMRALLDELVIDRKVPILGICVGMQIMAKKSQEGDMDGLCWIDAEVKKFSESGGDDKMQLPHMGWNDVMPIESNTLFQHLERDARFYFLHSYYFAHKQDNQIMSQTDYHGMFTSSARQENVYGVQFHPEKSHNWGIQLLKNFSDI